MWDAATGHELWQAMGPSPDQGPWGNPLAFSPDGRLVATAGEDWNTDHGTVTIRDAETGRETLVIMGHSGSGINGVTFFDGGRRIATASDDRTAKIWDARTGDEVLTLRGHGDLVIGVVSSPDGRRLATFSADYTLKIWDTVRLTPELLAIRAAIPRVRALFNKPLLREDVLETLRHDAGLSEPLSKELLILAEHYSEDGNRLNNASWTSNSRPLESYSS
jgi:WD40 repeat protein